MDALIADFQRRFGRPPVVAARAPGRVNLIGEHTDYNAGLVLPCAIDRDTVALAARRPDARFCVYSRELDERAEFDVAEPVRHGSWIAYVQGVVAALSEAGLSPGGLDLALASAVPREAGLSSSAALGLAVITAIDSAQGLGLEAEHRARLVHRGESEFVGVGCGLMDQFASALGRRDHALRIDCRSLDVRAVPLPSADFDLLIFHSGVERALARGGYGDRRDECFEALARAKRAGVAAPQATALRDLSPDALPELERALPSALFRRARHVIRENHRVDDAVAALEKGDLATMGAILDAGMASLRDDFEVSTPELDALCELAGSHPRVFGSRLTGAGFGGCTLHLVQAGAAAEVAESVAEGFAGRFRRRPAWWEVRAADGAAQLPL